MRERLRSRVLTEMQLAGFVVQASGLLSLPDGDDEKAIARELHSLQRGALLARSAEFILEWEDKVLEWFANGGEVDVDRIKPRVFPVESELESAVFRYASLHWSVPVSQGYGRRTRFLVTDETNGKLIGIMALGDPVFNLGVRDRLIEWDQAQRKRRLYNVYDAFVLGAVEPYRQLLAGKLVALCAVSNEIASYLTSKYEGKKTVISKESKSAEPVLVTTTSALGRSSVYNRLAVDGRLVFRSIGFTEGFGHFHFSDELFDELAAFVRSGGAKLRGHQYGDGPNWRIRTLRAGLESIGLDGDLLRHGIRREVFIAPRGLAWQAVLRGETDELLPFDYPLEYLSGFWRERWAVPRAARRPEFADHVRDALRLSPLLASVVAAHDELVLGDIPAV